MSDNPEIKVGDRCPICDKPPAPGEVVSNLASRHIFPDDVPAFTVYCWKPYYGNICSHPPVDWRARALAAEKKLSDPWQPIETAPRDGNEFIGFGVLHGSWGYTEDEERWTGARWSSESKRFRSTMPGARYDSGWTFSHWMPLPDLPNKKAKP